MNSVVKEWRGWINRKEGSGRSRQEIVTKVDLSILWYTGRGPRCILRARPSAWHRAGTQYMVTGENWGGREKKRGGKFGAGALHLG